MEKSRKTVEGIRKNFTIRGRRLKHETLEPDEPNEVVISSVHARHDGQGAQLIAIFGGETDVCELDISSFEAFKLWCEKNKDVVMSRFFNGESKQFFTQAIDVILAGEEFFEEAKKLLEVEDVLTR